jgi:hypothetical protein
MIHPRMGEINTPGFPSEIAEERIVGARPLWSFELPSKNRLLPLSVEPFFKTIFGRWRV